MSINMTTFQRTNNHYLNGQSGYIGRIPLVIGRYSSAGGKI